MASIIRYKAVRSASTVDELKYHTVGLDLVLKYPGTFQKGYYRQPALQVFFHASLLFYSLPSILPVYLLELFLLCSFHPSNPLTHLSDGLVVCCCMVQCTVQYSTVHAPLPPVSSASGCLPQCITETSGHALTLSVFPHCTTSIKYERNHENALLTHKPRKTIELWRQN